MKRMGPFRTTGILLFLVAFAFVAAVAQGAEIKKTNTYDGKKVGNCIFSPEPLPKGEEKTYKPVDTLKCGEFENLYARCFFTKTIGSYGPDKVRASLWLSSLDQALLYEHHDVSGSSGWKQMVFYILDGKDSDFRATMRTLCVVPGNQGMEELDIKLVISAAKLKDTKYETYYDDFTNEVKQKKIETFSYTPMAAGSMVAVQDKVVKAEAPAWEDVKKALVAYWESPLGETFLDAAEPEEKPAVEGFEGFVMYTYGEMKHKIKVSSGDERTCTVGETDVKVYDDGKIEIFTLDFDYYRDCE